MGDSEGQVDQEALESSITNEEVSGVQEEKPNSEINEESNNESNEPQESEVAGEEEKGEAQEKTTADIEVEEQPQNPSQQLDVPGEEEKGEAQGETTADIEVEEQPQNPSQQQDVPGEEEKGEAQEETTADNEVEEQAQNPNQGVPGIQSSIARQQSHVKRQPSLSQSFQRSPSSTDRRTSQQVKSHTPLTNVVSSSDGRTMINPRTGKEVHSNITQTSSVWEKIPLAKILCPAWTTAQGNEVIDWETVDANEVVVHTEGCQPIAEESQNGDQPPAGTETEETGSQHDQPPPEEESGQKDHPTEEELSQHGEQQPVEQQLVEEQPVEQQPVEQQNTTEANAEEDSVRVSQKTGKKIRDSTIQTSRIWEKKPLSEILPHSGNQALCPGSTQKPEDQNSFFNWPDPFEF